MEINTNDETEIMAKCYLNDIIHFYIFLFCYIPFTSLYSLLYVGRSKTKKMLQWTNIILIKNENNCKYIV